MIFCLLLAASSILTQNFNYFLSANQKRKAVSSETLKQFMDPTVPKLFNKNPTPKGVVATTPSVDDEDIIKDLEIQE